MVCFSISVSFGAVEDDIGGGAEEGVRPRVVRSAVVVVVATDASVATDVWSTCGTNGLNDPSKKSLPIASVLPPTSGS